MRQDEEKMRLIELIIAVMKQMDGGFNKQLGSAIDPVDAKKHDSRPDWLQDARGEIERRREQIKEGSSVMGALAWTIYRPEHLVVIRGIGVFDIHFAMAFREAMRAEGAAGFCKLFDLSRADIDLSNEDLQTMVASTRLRGPIQSGPIAMYLGKTPPPLLVDMAILLRERVGHRRRVRLFTDESLARQWLAAEGPAVNPPQELLQLPPRHTMSASLRR